jgi:hypothetical protein
VNGNYAAVAARMRESLADLERVVGRAGELAERAVRTGDDGYWDGVALNLHGFYAGVERVFEDIAQTVDASVPSGSDWHRDLILQMSAELPNVRPPVIQRETRLCLDEYRSFRHVVRNGYSFYLRPSRLQELVGGLAACVEMTHLDLLQFAEALDRMAWTDDNRTDR